MHFYKMHGCGNDYIYFNCFEEKINNPNELAMKLSNRHTGIGGDGIVLILPSEVADCQMRMFNIDGSEGKMCGNAIRCVATFLYTKNIVKKAVICIETLSGIKECALEIENNKIQSVTVMMGKASFEPNDIPVLWNGPFIEQIVKIQNHKYIGTALSVGNPHLVLFLDDIKNLDLNTIGPDFEHYSLFKEGVNTEFIKVLSSTEIEMRVYERGSGETMACGTGACASVVAGIETGKLDPEKWIKVHLLGGILNILYKDGFIYMNGPATFVFEGDIIDEN